MSNLTSISFVDRLKAWVVTRIMAIPAMVSAVCWVRSNSWIWQEKALSLCGRLVAVRRYGIRLIVACQWRWCTTASPC